MSQSPPPRAGRRWMLAAVVGCAATAVVGVPGAAASSGAGASLWQPAGAAPSALLAQHDVVVQASHKQTLTLDRAGMAALLASAPDERSVAGKTRPLVIALPAPNGKFQRFKIVYSPVMEPALAGEHPDIRTYAGVGVSDRTATVRLDLTPLGFHASVRSAHGTWYVDPELHGSQARYASYMGAALVDLHGTRIERQSPFDTKLEAVKLSSALSVGSQLRVYRLALLSDPSYANYFGAANVTAAKVTLMNRVDQVYEDELSIRMLLVGNNDLINLNTNAQAYAPNGPCGAAACFTQAQLATCGSGTLTRNRIVVGQIIGADNYDIGHIAVGQDGGGIASLGVVGGNSKAQGCTGIPQPDGDYYAVDYVAHEMGHEYGGNHTFNGNQINCSGGNRNNATSVEPGSGSSIMAYAGICGSDDLQPHSDPYFSQRSFQEITTYTSSAQPNVNDVQTASLYHFGGGNEVQQVTFGPGFSTTTSSFTVDIGGNDSALVGAGGLAYTNANIQSAINAIAGFAGTVTVTGAAATGFTVTYAGASANSDVANLALTNLSCGGCFSSVDETNHGGTFDSFSVHYGGSDSVAFVNGTNYTAAAIQAALQGVNEVQSVALSGYTTNGASYTLNDNGNDSIPITRGQNNTAAGIQAAIQGGNEQQQVALTSFNGATQSFQVQYNGQSSAVLGAGGLAINNTNVAAAINAIPGFPGTVTSAGAGNGGFTATFGGASAQTDVASLSIVSCTGACTSTVRENVKGTTGIAGWIAGSTVSIGTVADTGYTVTFNGLGDVNPLAVTNGSGGASGSVSTTTNGTSGLLPTGATGAVAGFGAGAFSNTGFQVTFGGTLAGSSSVGALTLTNLSSGTSGFVSRTARGGPNNNNGSQILPTGNTPPTVSVPLGYTIPYLTPFSLTGSGSDADGDTVTYMWEQNDTGTGTNLVDNNKPTGPLFREFGTRLNAAIYNPHQSPSPGENAVDTNPTRVFPDMAQILADNTNARSGSCPAWNPATSPVPDSIGDCYSEFLPTSVYTGPMHFRLTVRDGHVGGGGVNSADTTVSLAPGTGPFLVTEPDTDAPSYPGNTTQTVTWNVAGTNLPPISTTSVDILLSTDGGLSFPTTLAAGTANDGSADVLLPNIDASHARIEVRAVGNVYFDVSDADFTIHARADQTISFDPIPDHTYGDADFDVSATASSGLTVTFTADGDCTVTGATVHITGAGSCTVTAHQAGDDDTNPAPDVPQSFSIARADQTISFAPIADHTYGDADFDTGATASSGDPVSLTTSGQCTASGTTVHITGAGSCTVTAHQAGDDNYNPAPDVSHSFAIAKASQVITFPQIPDKPLATPDFDPGASASSGLAITYHTNSTCSIVGGLLHLNATGTCKVTATQAGNANYLAAADVLVKFKVTSGPTIATTTVLTGPATAPTGSDIEVTATVTPASGSTVTSGHVQIVTATGTVLADVPVSGGTAVAHITAPGSSTTLKLHAVYIDDDASAPWKGSTSRNLKIKVH